MVALTEKIAILMSTYNGESYLADQIDSIINQSYSNWHLYIRDDGSSDATPDIIRHYSDKYSKISFVNDGNIINMGVIKSFMNLLENTDADFYMFSDQDDVWKTDKILNTLKFIKRHDYQSKPVCVYTNLQVVDNKLQGDEALLNHNWQDFLHLLFTNNAYGCTMMLNKRLKDLVNFDSIDYKNIFMHDWWLMLLAAAFGEVGYLNEKTILYRQHGNNQVGASSKKIWSYVHRIINPKRDRIALQRSVGLATEFYSEYGNSEKLNNSIKEYVKNYGVLHSKSSFFNNLRLVLKYPPLSVHFFKQLYYSYILVVFHSDY